MCDVFDDSDIDIYNNETAITPISVAMKKDSDDEDEGEDTFSNKSKKGKIKNRLKTVEKTTGKGVKECVRQKHLAFDTYVKALNLTTQEKSEKKDKKLLSNKI